MRFEDAINPYAKRDTSMFKIEVFKDWTKENGLSKPIVVSDNTYLSSNLLDTNDVSNIQLTATNYQVQEGGEHSFEFTTASMIPGNDKGDNILQALHLKFPPSFKVDEQNTDTDVAQISGDGVTVTDIILERD